MKNPCRAAGRRARIGRELVVPEFVARISEFHYRRKPVSCEEGGCDEEIQKTKSWRRKDCESSRGKRKVRLSEVVVRVIEEREK